MSDQTQQHKSDNYFIEEMEKRTTLFLKISLVLVALLFLGLLAANIFSDVPHFKSTRFVYILILLTSILLYLLLLRGYKKFSSFVLVFITWASMVYFIWNSRGIYDAANMGILVAILFSALLLSRKIAIIVSVISLLNYWVVVYLTMKGQFVPSFASPLNMARDYTAIMIATVALVVFYESTMRKSVVRITELMLKNEKDRELIVVSENSYLEIFESIDDAIFIHNIENGAILDFNLSACAIFGYQKKELEKLTIEDLSAVNEGYDGKLGLEKIYEAQKNGHSKFEWRSKRANGEIFWSDVQLKYSNIDGENRILAVVRDISEVRKATEKLRFNEEQYRTLISNIPGAVYRCQVFYPWKTLYFSDEIFTISGYNAYEFMEREIKFGDLMHPDDKNQVEVMVEKAIREHSSFNLEYRFFHKDGSTRWVLEKGQVKYNELGQPLWLDGVMLDITEKKIIEKGLQEERNIMRTMIDTLRVNIYVKDTESKFILANTPICKLIGKELNEIIGKTDFDFFEKKKAQDFFDDEQNIMKTGNAMLSKIEYMLNYKNEETVLITSKLPLYNSEGKIIGIVGSGIDITDRIRAEKNLREERNILRTIFDTIPINLYLKNRESRILLANKPIINPIRDEEEDVIGKTDFDLFTKEQAQAFYNDEQELMKTGKPIIGKLEHMKNNLGQSFIMLTSKLPLINTDGIITGLVGCGLDISARIEAEEKVKQLNESLELKVEERTSQLAQANKDLEAFAYSISHDLRAPLRHIDGFVKLMFSNINEPSPNLVSYFEKINTASKRMSVMIDDLLGFSRLGRKEIILSRVNLNSMIHEIIEQFKPDISSRNVEWKIGSIPTIMADKGLIRTAFENLISNAIKYTGKTKSAIIEIGANELINNKVEIFVKDNGAGFDMVYAKKLFGVFQRLHTNEEFEGTGIGLANVKQIMAKHNGEIRAEGKLNEGAIFYITLTKS